MREIPLQTALLLAAPRELPTLRLFRRNVGEARMRSGHTVSFAIKGQCDLWGIVRGTSRHIEIELKAAGAPKKLPPDQEAWRQFCMEWGVAYTVLRGGKDESSEQTIARWCEELRKLV